MPRHRTLWLVTQRIRRVVGQFTDNLPITRRNSLIQPVPISHRLNPEINLPGQIVNCVRYGSKLQSKRNLDSRNARLQARKALFIRRFREWIYCNLIACKLQFTRNPHVIRPMRYA
jgi:hypothetical protein